MENKNFDDYEDINLILDDNMEETIIFIESTEENDLKDLAITEEN